MRRYGTFILVLALLVLSVVTANVTQAQTSVPAWQPNTAYATGAQVTYQDASHPNHLYKCIQGHTSQVGWEPPYVPALWQDLGVYNGGSATNTSVPPTATKTNTPVGPTATRTNTPVGPTATRTNTPVPPTATKTNTPSSGCSAPAYSSTAIYVNGNQVSYNGHLWQAKWWTQGEAPSTGGSGVWTDLGVCGTQPTATNTPLPTFAPPTNTPGPSATPTRVPPSPTPCTNCGGSLPKHVITGYWQDFTGNGATALRLSAVPTTYTLIAVAFANATGTPGAVSFSIDPQLSSALGGYTDANFISDVALLHSQGRKVIISVGGQNGTVSVSDSTSAANFANSVYSIMTQYGFDGVDIDLENGINPTYMGSALQQLSGKAGSSLIITLAPQTIDMQSTGSGYFQLALNIKSILTIVNTQYYNSGSMLGCDGKVYSQGTEDFLTALACIQLQGGLRPDQVGLGLPANASGAGGGAVAPSVVNAALDCLTMGTNCGTFKPPTTWPGIRGAMDWDINWDANASYNFANTVYNHFSAVP